MILFTTALCPYVTALTVITHRVLWQLRQIIYALMNRVKTIYE